jgi:hypothetical protein
MAREPQTPPESVILQKFTGLKNTVSAERFAPGDLETAINIDLDDAGQVHRRRGYRRVAAGSFHSLFTADGGTTLGVKDNDLGIIFPDYSFAVLKVGVGAARIVYEQLGPIVYFSSSTTSGKIDLGSMTVSAWGAEVSPGRWLSPVVNPTSNLAEVRGKLLGRPPLAQHLTSFNGRLYLADGRVVWATELWLPDWVDKTRNFLHFESEVTMLGRVTDGIYVGTRDAVWFLSGTFPLKRQRVLDSGVLPGSMIYMPSELANPAQVDLNYETPIKMALMFMTTRGVCTAQEQGVCYNLTETSYTFPAGQSVAAFYRRQDGNNHYISVVDSEGSPSSDSRIGDFVDAEVRRGGKWKDLAEGPKFGDLVTADIVHHP